MQLTFVVPAKEIDRLVELGYLFKGKRVSKKVIGPDGVVLRVKVPMWTWAAHHASKDQTKG